MSFMAFIVKQSQQVNWRPLKFRKQDFVEIFITCKNFLLTYTLSHILQFIFVTLQNIWYLNGICIVNFVTR